MKLSSSSSNSATSFDPKICTPRSATAGCLTGILRRILCFSTLQTHPADHIAEANSVTSFKNLQFDESKVISPGIVGSLMGLNTLPKEIGFLNPSPSARNKSMNSADYKQDSLDLIHGKHRRVNSTLSYRDMPEYFELENEEYFVLTFEKKSKSKEIRSKGRKCKGDNVVQKLESECNSEDSSPVSVLNFDQFIIQHDDVPTSEGDWKAEGSNSSRRKLSAHMENHGCQSLTNDGNVMEDDKRTGEAKNRKQDCQSEMDTECWDAICRISEIEVAKSTWLCTQSEEIEEISAEFGSKILDRLVDELIVQQFFDISHEQPVL